MNNIAYKVYDNTLNKLFDVKAIDFTSGKVYYDAYNTEGYYRTNVELLRNTEVCDKRNQPIFESYTCNSPYNQAHGITGVVVFEGGRFKIKGIGAYAGLECDVTSMCEIAATRG